MEKVTPKSHAKKERGLGFKDNSIPGMTGGGGACGYGDCKKGLTLAGIAIEAHQGESSKGKGEKKRKNKKPKKPCVIWGHRGSTKKKSQNKLAAKVPGGLVCASLRSSRAATRPKHRLKN